MDTIERIAVMQAEGRGEIIQFVEKAPCMDWQDLGKNFALWNWEKYNYRVKPPEKQDRRLLVLAAASDLARDFIYYHRGGDEELPRGEIEKALRNGEITLQEIVDQFTKGLKDHLEN